jgi:hypothetical protein
MAKGWTEYVDDKITRASGLVTTMQKAWQNHEDPELALQVCDLGVKERRKLYPWRNKMNERRAMVYADLEPEERKAVEASVQEAAKELIWCLFEIDRLAEIFEVPKYLDVKKQMSVEEKEEEEHRRKRQEKFRKIREG